MPRYLVNAEQITYYQFEVEAPDEQAAIDRCYQSGVQVFVETGHITGVDATVMKDEG